MIAPNVSGPFVLRGWREKRVRRMVNAPPILSIIDADYNDRRAFSGLCLAKRLRKEPLKGKEDYR